jgi:hypothetical protein
MSYRPSIQSDDEILNTIEDSFRNFALEKDLYWKWFGSSMLKWTIGYGYGARYFRSLIWVIALIIIGVLVMVVIPSSFVVAGLSGITKD